MRPGSRQAWTRTSPGLDVGDPCSRPYVFSFFKSGTKKCLTFLLRTYWIFPSLVIEDKGRHWAKGRVVATCHPRVSSSRDIVWDRMMEAALGFPQLFHSPPSPSGGHWDAHKHTHASGVTQPWPSARCFLLRGCHPISIRVALILVTQTELAVDSLMSTLKTFWGWFQSFLIRVWELDGSSHLKSLGALPNLEECVLILGWREKTTF